MSRFCASANLVVTSFEISRVKSRHHLRHRRTSSPNTGLPFREVVLFSDLVWRIRHTLTRDGTIRSIW